MTIAAILRQKGTDVVHVTPAATLSEVASTLSVHHIGAALVLDAVRQVIGIVSERDVVRNLSAHGAEALDMTAAQVMTRELVTANPAMRAEDALRLMTDGRFRHLPVLEDGRLCGLVSIGDVVKLRLQQQEHEVDSLRAYVSGAG